MNLNLLIFFFGFCSALKFHYYVLESICSFRRTQIRDHYHLSTGFFSMKAALQEYSLFISPNKANDILKQLLEQKLAECIDKFDFDLRPYILNSRSKYGKHYNVLQGISLLTYNYMIPLDELADTFLTPLEKRKYNQNGGDIYAITEKFPPMRKIWIEIIFQIMLKIHYHTDFLSRFTLVKSFNSRLKLFPLRAPLLVQKSVSYREVLMWRHKQLKNAIDSLPDFLMKKSNDSYSFLSIYILPHLHYQFIIVGLLALDVNPDDPFLIEVVNDAVKYEQEYF